MALYEDLWSHIGIRKAGDDGFSFILLNYNYELGGNQSILQSIDLDRGKTNCFSSMYNDGDDGYVRW